MLTKPTITNTNHNTNNSYLAKRIIACLDVKDGQVVKGVQFKNHEIVGDIVTLAKHYSEQGVDELVFYDISASVQGRVVDRSWVKKVARLIDIPFCVAGGICSVADAEALFAWGADKISINSPALANPDLISQLAVRFGVQAVVVGIDSWFDVATGHHWVKQYTGDETRSLQTTWQLIDWLREVQNLGAGEIVLNTMNQDGLQSGYDIQQLSMARRVCHVPLVASAGAGQMQHFFEVFDKTQVDAALAASVFHKGLIDITSLKQYLHHQGIAVRI